MVSVDSIFNLIPAKRPMIVAVVDVWLYKHWMALSAHICVVVGGRTSVRLMRSRSAKTHCITETTMANTVATNSIVMRTLSGDIVVISTSAISAHSPKLRGVVRASKCQTIHAEHSPDACKCVQHIRHLITRWMYLYMARTTRESMMAVSPKFKQFAAARILHGCVQWPMVSAGWVYWKNTNDIRYIQIVVNVDQQQQKLQFYATTTADRTVNYTNHQQHTLRKVKHFEAKRIK